MALRLPLNDVDLVVASFGVISKLSTYGLYKLNYVKHIVLDEADALFHDTFEEKLKVFMNRLRVCIDYIFNIGVYRRNSNNLFSYNNIDWLSTSNRREWSA